MDIRQYPTLQKEVMFMRKIWDTDGQGLVEYVIILVFIALFVIVILGLFGESLGGVFSNIINSI